MDIVKRLTQRISRAREASLEADYLMGAKSEALWAAAGPANGRAGERDGTVGVQMGTAPQQQRTANIGTIIWDLEGGAISWSEGVYLMLGMDREKHAMTWKRFLSAVVEKDRPRVRSIVKHQIKAGLSIGAEVGFECRIQRADGHIRWIRLVGEVSRSTFCDSTFVIATAQDVTRFKRSDREIQHTKTQLQNRLSDLEETHKSLIKARTEAEKENLTKSRFIAMISHEIRTPINGLLGTLSLLEDSQLDDPQRELLEVAVMSGENLRQLLNDVIDFARLETGNIQLEPSPFSMRKLAQRLIEFWQPQARTRGNSMVLNVANEVPEVLMGDTGRFGQVLNNLVSNAIKFTTDGSIAVVIRVDQDAAPEPSRCSLKIEVVDTGLGIARRDIPNLFKEFSQVVETSNDDPTRSFDSVVSQRGSGLGLAICRSLVDRMEGSISVSSVLGEGSTFCIRMPFEIATELKESVSANTDLGILRTAQGAAPRVLLVEDVPANQLVARMHLEKFGCVVDLANDGVDAVAACHRRAYDIILMDVSMPRMNGIDATIQIRGLPDNENVSTPIIGITAFAFTSEWEQFVEAGMNLVLSKPLQRETLHDAIQSFLAQEASVASRDDADPIPAGLDKEALEASIKGLSDDQVQRVIGQVRDDLSLHRENAISFAKDGRLKDLGRACHAIKGLAASFGGSALALTARKIEALVKSDDSEKAFTMTINRVGTATDELRTNLERFAEAAVVESGHG